MRIVFTSCCDRIRDPVQSAWRNVQSLAPDHIVLLGDNIYMDYGVDHKYGNHDLSVLAPGDPARFSALMHENYRLQWEVPAYQEAIKLPNVQVHAIWDDHDFAWNNALGGLCPADDERYVPPHIRRLSRKLFQQFRDVLASKPATYPKNPCPNGIVPPHEDLGSIYRAVDLAENIRLHLTDGRSFRQPERWVNDFLGDTQKRAIEAHLLPRENGINLFAIGVPLQKDWKSYSDKGWISRIATTHKILLLSGDIHRHELWLNDRPVDVTASAMAQPPVNPARIPELIGIRQETGIYGVLDIDHTTLLTRLFCGQQELQRHQTTLLNWM